MTETAIDTPTPLTTKPIPVWTFDELARKYCDQYDTDPTRLLMTLQDQKRTYPTMTGWFVSECQMLGSSAAGRLSLIVYGPDNVNKEPPTQPFSPLGLASDMATVIAVLPVQDLPDVVPQSLAGWAPPPPPKKSKRRKH